MIGLIREKARLEKAGGTGSSQTEDILIPPSLHFSYPLSFPPSHPSLQPAKEVKKKEIRESERNFSLKQAGKRTTMMLGKDDLGLSLSLSSSIHSHLPLQLNLMPPSSSSTSCDPSQPKPHWSNLLVHSAAEALPRPLLRGIDVNRVPAGERDSDEDAGASSPNSTLSSVGGKRAERDHPLGDEHDPDRASSRGISDEEDGEGSRKKLRLSKDQSAILEESFKEHNTLNPKQKLALAKQLNLRPRQVEVWFQNRRARTKLKQTEVDCEFLKRCCETLTEENRRLQKEVQELRALKLSPQFYMHMTPPTTLTMCPSCEHVANSATAAAPATNPSQMPEHPQLLHHRPIPAPWAPIPLRPFVDAPPQRS
ncbi:homeobox-leucine zipper protein HAT4-like isoform X2 [Canna indica]|uniref:Homeobox-leucine zipper protein HAT4-like isoform X2 n=1 Tax=Canna indica TaxID=4628 RepID=A0AAQ3QGP7_9LILI|nr:homeobox-leucine zipper protein HAT4-like isoform X2 [Canna indica]